MEPQIGALPEIGTLIHDFSLPCYHPTPAPGHTQVRRLYDSFGTRGLVLYFYPKDDTPGCTVEAKDFAELSPAFAEAGYSVYGLSPDNDAAHQKFCSKYGLPFPLFADTAHTVCQQYGVWVTKHMYGKPYEGVARTTLVCDAQGIVRAVWPKVQVPGHVAEVLETCRGMAA